MNMKNINIIKITCVVLLGSVNVSMAQSETKLNVGFEELHDSLGTSGVRNGSKGNGTYSFSQDGFNLSLNSNWDTSFGGYWAGGWAFSNQNYTTEEPSDFSKHLYASKPGKGSEVSGNVYAVGTDGSYIQNKDPLNQSVAGCYISNTTYAYNSMKLGDQIAKKFESNDSFALIVDFYLSGKEVGSQKVWLADFRSASSEDHFILDSWQWVAFQFSNADSIVFHFESSDIGDLGINTPTYFCLDEIQLVSGAMIEESLSPLTLSVYPNPFSEFIQIDIQEGIKNIQLIDLSGKAQSLSLVNNKTLNTSMISGGAYILTVFTKDGRVHHQKVWK
jgi:hypothetical protein